MIRFKFKKQDPLRWQDRLRRQDENEDDELFGGFYLW